MPKVNFPGELPDLLAANVLPPMDCENLIVDHDSFYVVDMCVSRNNLGRNVYRTQRKIYHTQSGVVSGPGAPTPPPTFRESSTRAPPMITTASASGQPTIATAQPTTAPASDQLAVATADGFETWRK